MAYTEEEIKILRRFYYEPFLVKYRFIENGGGAVHYSNQTPSCFVGKDEYQDFKQKLHDIRNGHEDLKRCKFYSVEEKGGYRVYAYDISAEAKKEIIQEINSWANRVGRSPGSSPSHSRSPSPVSRYSTPLGGSPATKVQGLGGLTKFV